MKGKLSVLGVVLILLLGFASGPAHAGSRAVIKVPDPTGIPETDWVSIQEALNSAEPGEKVRLAVGTYKVHKPIVTEGFEGTLEGAGMDQTIVEAVRGSQGQGFELVNHPSVPFPIPTLFWFDSPHRQISIKTMTLQVLDPEPSDAYYLPWTGDTTNLNNLLVISGGGECEVRVKNVAMKGAPSTADLSWGGKNLSFALIIENMGDAAVKNSHFEHAAGFAMEVDWPQSNSTVRIEHNTTYECSSAVYAESAGGTENITCSIADNHFQLYRHEWGQGVVIADGARFSGDPAFNRVTVVNNTFSGASWRFLEFYLLEDLKVAENRIVGSGDYALRLLGSSNSRVFENDAAGFEASVASIAAKPLWGFPADNNLIAQNTFGEADEAAIICAGNGNAFRENEYTGHYPGSPDARLWWFQEGSADNQVIEPKVETEPEMDEDQIRALLWRDDNDGTTGNVLILDDDDAD